MRGRRRKIGMQFERSGRSEGFVYSRQHSHMLEDTVSGSARKRLFDDLYSKNGLKWGVEAQ